MYIKGRKKYEILINTLDRLKSCLLMTNGCPKNLSSKGNSSGVPRVIIRIRTFCAALINTKLCDNECETLKNGRQFNTRFTSTDFRYDIVNQERLINICC